MGVITQLRQQKKLGYLYAFSKTGAKMLQTRCSTDETMNTTFKSASCKTENFFRPSLKNRCLQVQIESSDFPDVMLPSNEAREFVLW